MPKSEMQEYKEYVTARLSELSPFLQSYALGDFSETLDIPEKEDEFTELLVGLTLMVEDIKEMIREREDTIAKIKQAEQALRTSEEKYRSMIMNLGEGFYNATLDGTLLDHNMEFNRILGFDPEENLVGIQLPDFWQDPKDRKKYLEEFSKQGFIKSYPIAAKRRNGEEIFVEASSRLVKDEQGKPVRLEGTFIDVTKQVKAQRALQESEERFRNTFEQAAVGLAHVSPAGQFLRVNQKVGDILGYTQEELLASTYQDMTHPDDVETDLAYVRQTLAGERSTYSMEKRYIRKDGSLVWVNLTVALVRMPSGEPKYFISAIQDISQRKQAEQELTKALADLRRTNAELESFNRMAVGRELRMIELKRQVNELSEKLGKEPPYDVSFVEEDTGGV